MRTSCEFERYANVEILELIYVYIVIGQTEEGLMSIMNSYKLTIFLDVKTEVAGVEREPNEESMWHAQARGSMPYGCVKESRYRQRLRWMHAYQEEHDVCSSFHGVNLLKSWKVDAGYAQSMVIVVAEDAGQCVLGMDNSSAKSISVSSDEIRLGMCRKAVNEVKGTSTTEHLETFKMECGGGRIPLTSCAVLLRLRRLERGCELCNEVTSVIFIIVRHWIL